MTLTQGGLLAQDFRITPEETKAEEVEEVEVEEEAEEEDHLQLREEEIQMIEAMARS